MPLIIAYYTGVYVVLIGLITAKLYVNQHPRRYHGFASMPMREYLLLALFVAIAWPSFILLIIYQIYTELRIK
jgi:hypothetical protein